MPLAIVCLGNEPLVFGPFDDEENVRHELDMHVDESKDLCPNNVSRMDHHVLPLQKGWWQS